jgi:hypothetical protein
MSIEQLLFFLLLMAIPLLERLVRAMRARTDGSVAEPSQAPAEADVSRSRSPVAFPDAGATELGTRPTELPLPGPSLPPALPRPVRHAASAPLPASERKPHSGRERQQAFTRRRIGHLDRPTRSGTALRPVIAGGDLRRAIVLAAILGPCRALEPKDPSQPG